MKYFLAQFSDNWADEMDIEGFVLLTEEEKDETVKGMRINFDECNTKWGYEIGFGTNQGKSYKTFDEVLKQVGIKEVTKEEYDTLIKFFPYGHGNPGPLVW